MIINGRDSIFEVFFGDVETPGGDVDSGEVFCDSGSDELLYVFILL